MLANHIPDKDSSYLVTALGALLSSEQHNAGSNNVSDAGPTAPPGERTPTPCRGVGFARDPGVIRRTFIPPSLRYPTQMLVCLGRLLRVLLFQLYIVFAFFPAPSWRHRKYLSSSLGKISAVPRLLRPRDLLRHCLLFRSLKAPHFSLAVFGPNM